MKIIYRLIIMIAIICYSGPLFAQSQSNLDLLALEQKLDQQVERLLQCKTSINMKYYGMYPIGGLRLFTDLCGGNGIVLSRNSNQQWVLKNCGPVSGTQIPTTPSVPFEDVAEVGKEYTQWIQQDVCNIWHPLPLSAKLQQDVEKANKADDQLEISIAQQTGCKVVKLLLDGSPILWTRPLEIQLLCPGNVVKVIYRANPTDPFQTHICQTAGEKVCFQPSKDEKPFCHWACR